MHKFTISVTSGTLLCFLLAPQAVPAQGSTAAQGDRGRTSSKNTHSGCAKQDDKYDVAAIRSQTANENPTFPMPGEVMSSSMDPNGVCLAMAQLLFHESCTERQCTGLHLLHRTAERVFIE